MSSPACDTPDLPLKPLLVTCFPEAGGFFSPDFANAIPALEPWEIALSRSCQDHGLMRPLAACWRVHGEPEAEQLLGRLDLFDLLVVAPMSLNSLAKFALGIRDSFPSRIFGAMADLGKPILLESSNIPRDDALINPHFSKVYRRYWDSIRGGSVDGFARPDFDTQVSRLVRTRRALHGRPPSAGRAVLTRDDVLTAFKAMQPLIVPHGAILTDLAREEAQARGVAVHFE